jgi:hypothetical protein
MNELQLTPAPPLPDDVRERVLRTVLAGTNAPHRRLAPLVAAAVTVVAVLAGVTTAVSLSGSDADRPDTLPAASGPPAPTGDAAVDEALSRCAAAVATSGARGEYPPTAEWRVTDVLEQAGERQFSDTELVIDGSFACHAGPFHVWLSTVGGRPAGGTEVARLAPGTLILFNPQLLLVEVDPGEGYIRTSTRPVQIVQLTPTSENWPTRRLIVRGSYDGPLPDPGDVAVEVQDRPIPNQEVPARDLEGCLRDVFRPWQVGEEEPQETVLSREAEGDTPRPLVGRINGTWAAVCYDDPGGPVNVEGGLAADRLSETRLATAPGRGRSARGALCTVQNGLALCMLRAEGAVDVGTTGGGTPAVLPVP